MELAQDKRHHNLASRGSTEKRDEKAVIFEWFEVKIN